MRTHDARVRRGGAGLLPEGIPSLRVVVLLRLGIPHSVGRVKLENLGCCEMCQDESGKRLTAWELVQAGWLALSSRPGLAGLTPVSIQILSPNQQLTDITGLAD